MDDIRLSPCDLFLKASQIVCLEYQNNTLYGEVIQLIPHRQKCWFRPLCLVISPGTQSNREENSRWDSWQLMLQQDSVEYSTNYSESLDGTKLIDLQSSPDLLWPDSLFRPAIDTEIINLLPQLEDISYHLGDKIFKQKCLNQFIHLVWQAHQDKF
ncbi:MAG: hypothetical protein RLZZ04_190 [Cyanobacteriota bacterium]|jgi:hypothetical protein